MKLVSNKLLGTFSILHVILIASVISLNPDEEDELLDEIIPHHISKRKFYSPSKRQFIQAGYGGQDAGQLEQMPQTPNEQFAGNTEQLPPALAEQTQSPVEQTIGQGQLDQGLGQSQPQVEQFMGGNLPQSGVTQQFTQVDSGAQARPVMEQTKNYDPNSVTEMSLTDNNGYRVTTAAKEKATHLASDVKDYGLWEYSADNNAPSTDQTAKLLQTKLVDEDKSFQGKDSASLNVNQLANAQGSKVDGLLDLFNQGSIPSEPAAKNIDSLESATKGLEAYDSATKGFSAIEDSGKKFLSNTNKGIEDTNLDTQTSDFTSPQNSQADDVSVVNLPNANSFTLEDEHGNSLDNVNTAAKPHPAPKNNGKMVQILKKLLKNKLRAQAARLIMKHKNNHEQLLSSLNPLKRISKLLQQVPKDAQGSHAMPPISEGMHAVSQALKGGTQNSASLHASPQDQHPVSQDTEGPHSSKQEISSTELKLLKFIKKMLSGDEKSGINEDQMKLFMAALKETTDAKPSSETNDKTANLEKAVTNMEKEMSKASANSQQKVEALPIQKPTANQKLTSKDDNKADNKDDKTADANKNDNEATKVSMEAAKSDKEVTKIDKEATKSDKEAIKSDKEAIKGDKESMKGDKQPGKDVKQAASEKLKVIQALLKKMRPTAKSGHGSFYLDPEEPLGNTGSENSNTLMNYLEHETALVDQFQEGSQMSDPAQQLKHLANLMIKVANKAKPKGALVDARRTTVSANKVAATEKSSGKDIEGIKSDSNVGKEADDKSKDLGKVIKSGSDQTMEKENKSGSDQTMEKENKSGSNKNEKQETTANKFESEKQPENQSIAGKENESKDKGENDESKSVSKETERGKDKSSEKQEGNKELSSENKLKDFEGVSGKNENEKQVDSKTFSADESSILMKGNEKKADSQKAAKELDGKDADKGSEKQESEAQKTDKEQSVKADDSVKESKKLPEVQKARNNNKVVDKVNKEGETSNEEAKFSSKEETSSKLDDKTHSSLSGVDIESKNDNSIKEVKKLPELSKLRNNKKIVSKIDSSDEKSASKYKSQTDDSKEASIQGKGSASEKDSPTITAKFNDDLSGSKEQQYERVSGKYAFHEHELKVLAKDVAREHEGQIGDKPQSSSDTSNKGLSPSSQRDEGTSHDGEAKDEHVVTPSISQTSRHISPGSGLRLSNASAVSEIAGSTVQPHLTPQLPFLNPGRAHLDVLESDQSLKQYLTEKGKNGTLPRLNPESFDDDDSGKLLHVKDVTGVGKTVISEKPNAKPHFANGKHNSKFGPYLVPPAGQGGLPLGSKLHSKHAIRPITRSLWNKYKSILSRMNMPVSSPNRNLVKLASLRQTNPVLANQIDTPSRYAALAQLVAIAKKRQRLIDVAASKKSITRRIENMDLKIKDLGMKTSQETAPITEDKPVITSFYKAPVVSIPTKGVKLSMNNDGDAALVPEKQLVEEKSGDERPGDEKSRLVSRVKSAEVDTIVNPSDVTRSQLEKPKKPSINQVMDLLAGQENAKGNNKAINVSSATMQLDVSKSESPVNNKGVQALESSGSNVRSPASANIVPANTIPAKGLILKINKLAELNKIKDWDKLKATDYRENLSEKSINVEADVKTRIQPVRKPSILIPVHEYESGKAFVRKQDARNLIRTIKADADTANFLLRKRNKVPRPKKARRGKQRLTGH